MWIITQMKYDNLRTIEGCEGLEDLEATKTDATHILNIARGFGIPESRLFRNDGSTFAELKATELKIRKMSSKMTEDGIPHTLLVYAGGHGASKDEQQIFLTNSAEAKNVPYQIEYKLR